MSTIKRVDLSPALKGAIALMATAGMHSRNWRQRHDWSGYWFVGWRVGTLLLIAFVLGWFSQG